MIQIERILFPTDFSEYAEYAVPYVVDFARKFSAKVTVVHAVVIPTYTASYEIAIDLTSLRGSIEEAARNRMKQVEQKFAAEGIQIEGLTRVGNPFVEIINVAGEQKADLIIMATHGWGAFKQLLLGSTTERVVRKAPCPVLTIRHPEHEFVHP